VAHIGEELGFQVIGLLSLILCRQQILFSPLSRRIVA
jgi:hypothetical protein